MSLFVQPAAAGPSGRRRFGHDSTGKPHGTKIVLCFPSPVLTKCTAIGLSGTDALYGASGASELSRPSLPPPLPPHPPHLSCR
eukprot:3423804-Rhodomonas_salina.1